MRKCFGITILALLVCVGLTAAVLAAGSSDYATGTTAAVTTYAPNVFGPIEIKSLYATGDDATSALAIYAKSGKYAVTVAATNAARIIYLVNTNYVLTTNDMVVYYHTASRACDTATVSSATTSNVTLSAGISEAGVAGDFIYEMAQDYALPVGATSVSYSASPVYRSPGDSPVQVMTTATGTCSHSVTAEW